MNTLMIVLTVWVIGGLITYFQIFKEEKQFRKIWYSVVWPALIPLYIIHLIKKAQ